MLKDGQIEATVENKGEFDTEEVVQVYIRCEDSQFAPPNPQLCGFKRVFVKAKESVSVEIPISPRAYTVVDEEGNRFTPGGAYTLYVGLGQPDGRTEELIGSKPVALQKNMDKEV